MGRSCRADVDFVPHHRRPASYARRSVAPASLPLTPRERRERGLGEREGRVDPLSSPAAAIVAPAFMVGMWVYVLSGNRKYGRRTAEPDVR